MREAVPISKARSTRALIVAAIAGIACLLAFHAHAQSSLGIGANEAMLPVPGPFGRLMAWVNVEQQRFYRALAETLKAMRQDGSKLWVLVGLSFAYGVFHAAGPGHGKAVISSYMVANEVALKRGIVLSFLSAFLQGLVAIAMIALIYFLLRGTTVNMTNATRFLEVMSFGLVMLFGAWLLWQKAMPRLRSLLAPRPAAALATGPGQSAILSLAFSEPLSRDDGRIATNRAQSGYLCEHDPMPGKACTECGRSHAPDPSLLSGRDFDWRTAWSAIVAVGIRPCTGALIVLSFALLNGLWAGGVVSVLAMSLGTAITVSALATLAVLAKNWAVALGGGGRWTGRIHATLEIGGAALVFLLGLFLLLASLGG